jgi:hypothetical protein
VHEDATKQLRLDRRLAGRRGWIAQNELAGELDRLPDVGDKAELIEAPASRSPDEPSPQGS